KRGASDRAGAPLGHRSSARISIVHWVPRRSVLMRGGLRRSDASIRLPTSVHDFGSPSVAERETTTAPPWYTVTANCAAPRKGATSCVAESRAADKTVPSGPSPACRSSASSASTRPPEVLAGIGAGRPRSLLAFEEGFVKSPHFD